MCVLVCQPCKLPRPDLLFMENRGLLTLYLHKKFLTEFMKASTQNKYTHVGQVIASASKRHQKGQDVDQVRDLVVGDRS